MAYLPGIFRFAQSSNYTKKKTWTLSFQSKGKFQITRLIREREKSIWKGFFLETKKVIFWLLPLLYREMRKFDQPIKLQTIDQTIKLKQFRLDCTTLVTKSLCKSSPLECASLQIQIRYCLFIETVFELLKNFVVRSVNFEHYIDLFRSRVQKTCIELTFTLCRRCFNLTLNCFVR